MLYELRRMRVKQTPAVAMTTGQYSEGMMGVGLLGAVYGTQQPAAPNTTTADCKLYKQTGLCTHSVGLYTHIGELGNQYILMAKTNCYDTS